MAIYSDTSRRAKVDSAQVHATLLPAGQLDAESCAQCAPPVGHPGRAEDTGTRSRDASEAAVAEGSALSAYADAVAASTPAPLVLSEREQRRRRRLGLLIATCSGVWV